MSTRQAFALILVSCTLSQVGCVCMMNSRCGSDGLCGMGCDASCGVADSCCDGPGCGIADSCCGGSCCSECESCPTVNAGCGCPEPSCGCCDSCCGDGICDDECCGDQCCGSVDCGSTPTRGRMSCPLLARLRNAICGCNGCGGEVYSSEWHNDPPCDCENCDCYGNHTGGPYGTAYGRRAQLARRNIANELRFSEEGSETVYR